MRHWDLVLTSKDGVNARSTDEGNGYMRLDRMQYDSWWMRSRLSSRGGYTVGDLNIHVTQTDGGKSNHGIFFLLRHGHSKEMMALLGPFVTFQSLMN